MSFFVDANVFIYSVAPGELRGPCVEILDAIARGEAAGQTSAAVLEEVWHVERSGRAGEIGGLAADAYTLMTPLLAVDDASFRRALQIETDVIGTNDRLHVGTCLAHGIDRILSADRGFDGLADVRRIDPGDARAVGSLLRAG